MNLRTYYEKIREFERQIEGECAVVVSLETPDGGKPGQKTEAPKRVAAKMVVDGSARLATVKEATAFRDAQAEAAAKVERDAAAARVQVTLVAAPELEAIRRGNSPKA